jgi:hypothetical protein
VVSCAQHANLARLEIRCAAMNLGSIHRVFTNGLEVARGLLNVCEFVRYSSISASVNPEQARGRALCLHCRALQGAGLDAPMLHTN